MNIRYICLRFKKNVPTTEEQAVSIIYLIRFGSGRKWPGTLLRRAVQYFT
jgi:hypothetical protein